MTNINVLHVSAPAAVIRVSFGSK